MPVKYLLIYIDKNTFYRIIRFAIRGQGANSDLYFMCDKKQSRAFKKKLKEPNEFIRLKYEERYMDLTLDKFIVEDFHIRISFAKVLDYNHIRFDNYVPKKKKNKE